MTRNFHNRRLDVDNIDGVTVVNVLEKKLIDEDVILDIGEQLFSLVDQDGRRAIVLNLENVTFLSSAFQGRIIILNKKLRMHQGKLVLCGISKVIMPVFEITKLDKLFRIEPSLDRALACFDAGFERRVLTAVCPVDDCGGEAASTGVDARPEQLTCSSCCATLTLAKNWQKAPRVHKLALPTYENERIEAELKVPPPPAATKAKGVTAQVLKVIGRLDLFAGQLLEKVWRTLPPPRHVLFDLRGATEISARAAESVLTMCRPEAKTKSQGTILIDQTKPSQANAFGPNDSVHADEAAAWLALADLPGNVQPLAVTMKPAS